MTYVYVLTSTPNDLYYEQCLMSLYSMRLYMPNSNAVVLVDDKTFSSLTEENKRAELSRLASEIIKVDFEDSVPNVDRSRLIKTSIPDYVDDDFLYIDCDTIICDDLYSIEKCEFNTAGILDGHVMLDEHVHKKYFLARDKKLGFHATKEANYSINGGVIFCRKSEEGRTLFKNWNELWKFSAYKKHDKHDQSALNEANWKSGFKMGLLSGEWNCQPGHCGLAFLKNAKILHYFSSEFNGKNYISYYKLADKDLQNRIKNEGTIPDDVKKMISDPKFQFTKVHLLKDQRIVNIMQSPLTFTLADINAKLPHFFNFLEAQAAFIRKIGKKLKK